MAAETFEFRTEIAIDASPELVYRFFTEADLLARWHGEYAETDPRPGGKFLLNVTGVDITRGEFLELDPGRRLVFTWGFLEAGSTTVEVTFEPKGDGTLVRVHQHGFKEAPSRDAHRDGWTEYLGRLAILATGGDPGPNPRRVSEADR